MLTSEETLVVLFLLWQIYKRKSPGAQRRKWLVRLQNAVRSAHGAYYSSVRQLRLSDAQGFHGHLRMSPTTFETLLGKVANRLVRVSRRPTFSPHERLALSLRYHATGTSQASMDFEF